MDVNDVAYRRSWEFADETVTEVPATHWAMFPGGATRPSRWSVSLST